MPERLSEEREAEMKPQQICDSPCESNGWECPDLRNLRAALDAERQAHAETRGEVERLAETVARDLERLGPLRTERDEAGQDAAEAVRLSGLSPRDLGADMADRIDGYRSATAPPKPAPPPARASRR